MVGLTQYFIFHSCLDIERYQTIIGIYIFPAVNYFPDLSHINMQGVKTHTVGNHAATPTLNHIYVDY